MENKKMFTKNGMFVLIGSIALLIFSIVVIVFSAIALEDNTVIFGMLPMTGGLFGFVLTVSLIVITITCFMFAGLKVVKPNEALVLTLFGNFHGVIQEPGFYFVNPFCQPVYPRGEGESSAISVSATSVSLNTGRKGTVSLKAMTLNNAKQKVNDANGNPIEIGVVVIWKVIDPIKAVFNVEDYRQFVSIQSDSSIRSVARSYVYDGEDGEKSLTGSTKEISDKLQEIIQVAVSNGGIEIIDAKIAHLAYSPEIASAMLQRQQADAIIAARQKIVEGAVGMVEQALQQLSEKEVVELDDERKAQMVTNLLVVLCANKEAQPIVNSGSIY